MTKTSTRRRPTGGDETESPGPQPSAVLQPSPGPRRSAASQPSPRHRRAGEVRLARAAWWVALATAALGGLLVWRLDADYGTGPQAAAQVAGVLAVATTVGGVTLAVLAVLAVVREQGPARIGAWLLLALVTVQPVFGWLGFQFATANPVREQGIMVAWALVSAALLYGSGVVVLRHNR